MRFKTMEFRGGLLYLLDQHCLPEREAWFECRNLDNVCEAINNLIVRGAPAIGVAAAYGMVLSVDPKLTGRQIIDKLEESASLLKSLRPTAVNLSWAVDRMMEVARNLQFNDSVELYSALDKEAIAIHQEDAEMCGKIGYFGAQLIVDGMTVLTHCNAGALATAGIGTALGVIYTARDQGKRVHVYVDETRPVLQGARLTMWELLQEGIDATLITDNTAAFLFAKQKINAVLVGADRITRNGDVANKIGTYNLAVLAAYHNIPFYVAAPSSTFDDSIETGADIIIEERSQSEVILIGGRCIAPVGSKVYSPAFDVTPNSLITAIISDTGIQPGGRAVL